MVRTELEINDSLDKLEHGFQELHQAQFMTKIDELAAQVLAFKDNTIPSIAKELKNNIDAIGQPKDALRKEVETVVVPMPKYLQASKEMQEEIARMQLKIDAITRHGVSTDALQQAIAKAAEATTKQMEDFNKQVQSQVSAQMAASPSGIAQSRAQHGKKRASR